MEKITLKVEGIKCQNCVNTVKQALEEFKVISNLEVSIAEKSVSFDVEKKSFKLKKIIKAIEKNGYKVVK
ncbi:MAG: heavy-metal-associated domain-containing protein [Candidatus Izemoplasmatales bacterium]|nr:heavy-metal-associated domain-containing protein [Candidatus Izemoplasmatales bacterium]